MVKSIKYITIFLFIVLISIPLVLFTVTDKSGYSVQEKRPLAKAPDVEFMPSNFKSFTQQFENFYNDHFGLREHLIRYANLVRIGWLKSAKTDEVWVGKNGWLFQNGLDPFKDMRNEWPFTNAQLDEWNLILQEKQNWLAARNIQYLFVITPNKHLIEAKHLPYQIKEVSSRSRLDQLVTSLKTNTDVNFLDLRSALTNANQDIRLYHKTDSHWNKLGAYVGYQQVINHLQAEGLSGILPVMLSFSSVKWVNQEGGDLAQSLNMQHYLKEKVPQFGSPIEKCVKYIDHQMVPDNATRNKDWFKTSCQTGKYRLLMFRDSYSLAMMPYLSQTFKQIYYIPHSPANTEAMKQIVEQFKPDIVIEQRSSGWLRTPQG